MGIVVKLIGLRRLISWILLVWRRNRKLKKLGRRKNVSLIRKLSISSTASLKKMGRVRIRIAISPVKSNWLSKHAITYYGLIGTLLINLEILYFIYFIKNHNSFFIG
jgi:hypothetical protein